MFSLKKYLLFSLGCLGAFSLYYERSFTFGFLLGFGWGILNLYLIQQLIQCLLIAEKRNPLKIILFTLVKFPLLYGLGYGLLLVPYYSPWSLLAGFSISLILSVFQRFLNPSTFFSKKIQQFNLTETPDP